MITYYKAIVWHLFLIKLERYEPGIVDKIAKYCGVLLNIPRKTFITSWLPVFQEYALVNISTFIRLTYQQQKQLCESMPIYDGHFLDYIKSITNMEKAEIDFTENGDILNLIKIKKNFIRLKITKETEEANAAPMIPQIGIKI